MTLRALISDLTGVRPLSGRAAREPLAAEDRIHIFVNGIFTDLLSTAMNALKLQRAREIPSRTMCYVHVSADLLVEPLSNAITHLVYSGREVEIHAHSRGSLAVEKALESLDDPEIFSSLHLRTYGGIRLLPPSLGGTVENHVNQEDLIIFLGRTFLGIAPDGRQSERVTYDLSLCLFFRNEHETPEEMLHSLCNRSVFSSIEEVCELASTLRIRSWRGDDLFDAHSFDKYLEHLTPTPAENLLEGKIRNVALQVQIAA